MERVAYTIWPEEDLSLTEWMNEFKVGRIAPKTDNGRAREMMESWSKPKKTFDQKLLGAVLDRIFRS